MKGQKVDLTFEHYVILLPYALSLIAGFVLRYIKALEPLTRPTFKLLNVVILWVMLPTVVFVSIARYSIRDILGFGNSVFFALSGLGVCFVVAALVSTLMHQDKKTTVELTLNSAFMNVTYLGLPIVHAMTAAAPPRPGLPHTWALGPASLYAVTIGIPHLIMGVALASSAGKRRVTPRFVLENVLVFPATIALITALLFIGFRAHLWDVVQRTFDDYLAKPFFLLMLLFTGYQMPIVDPRRYASKLAMVGALRFLVCPLVTLALVSATGLNIATDLTPKPSLILSAMPPGIFNIILAYNFKLDIRLCGALVFYLTIISLVIALPLIDHFLF